MLQKHAEILRLRNESSFSDKSTLYIRTLNTHIQPAIAWFSFLLVYQRDLTFLSLSRQTR